MYIYLKLYVCRWKAAFQSFIKVLLTVCRWHCKICSISILLSPTLPSLLIHVDLQPHYHSTGDASSVLHTNTCHLSSCPLPPLFCPPDHALSLHGTIFIFIHLHATPLLSKSCQYFLLLSFHLFSFYPELSISPLLHHSFQCPLLFFFIYPPCSTPQDGADFTHLQGSMEGYAHL